MVARQVSRQLSINGRTFQKCTNFSCGKVKAGNPQGLETATVEDLFQYLLIKEGQRPGYPPFIFISFQVKAVTEISKPTISSH